MPRPISASTVTSPFRARCSGPISTSTRRGPSAWSRRASPSWRGAGGRCSTRFDAVGVDVAYEIHPGEDLHDGLTFEMFLDKVERPPAGQHPLRPLALASAGHGLCGLHRHLRRAHPLVPRQGRRVPQESPRTGHWGGYQNWPTRAGRFRSPGDGQIDFGAIFAKLAEVDYDGWAVGRVGMLHQAPGPGRCRGRRAGPPPHHPGPGARLRRQHAGARRRSRAQPQGVGAEVMAAGEAADPHPARLRRRWARCADRPGAPDGGAAGRPVRGGGCRAVVRSPEVGGGCGGARHSAAASGRSAR